MNTSLVLKVVAVSAIISAVALWLSNPAAWSLVLAIIAMAMIMVALAIGVIKALGQALIGLIAKGCAVVVLVALLLGCTAVSGYAVINQLNTQHSVATVRTIDTTRCSGTITQDDSGTLTCTTDTAIYTMSR